MVVTIINDEIIKWSRIDQPDNVTKFDGPDDYDPLVYDYIPTVAGVYDINNFIRKPLINELFNQ